MTGTLRLLGSWLSIPPYFIWHLQQYYPNPKKWVSLVDKAELAGVFIIIAAAGGGLLLSVPFLLFAPNDPRGLIILGISLALGLLGLISIIATTQIDYLHSYYFGRYNGNMQDTISQANRRLTRNECQEWIPVPLPLSRKLRLIKIGIPASKALSFSVSRYTKEDMQVYSALSM